MEFDKFNSRGAAEEGARLHLCHPVTGEPLNDPKGGPCVVIVRGAESRKAQEAAARARNARAGKDEKPGSLEELHAQLVKAAKPLIMGFENLEVDGRPATAEDADAFLNLQMINGSPDEKSFAEQVLAFSTKRANYLGNA